MSVVSVTREARSRTATSPSPTAGDSEIELVIKVNSTSDNEFTIMQSGQIPLHGSSHPSNFQSTLREISWKSDGKFLWRATLKYSTRPESSQERERETVLVPWMRAADISCTPYERLVDALKDSNGQAIVNSFGTPFDPSPQKYEFPPVVSIRKAVPTIPSWFFTYGGKRNISVVQARTPIGVYPAFPAETAMFVPKELSGVQYEGPNGIYAYAWVGFELRYDANKWNYEPADKGPKYKDANGKVASFSDGGVCTEGYLDLAGGKLPGGPPWSPSQILYLPPFPIQGKADFSVLPVQ